MSNNNSSIKYHQFDSICRFCLKTDFILKPIFQECCESEANAVDEWDEYADPKYEYLNISGYVTKLTDLQIEQDDPYPKFICFACFNFIKAIKAFQTTCVASFEVLEEVKTSYRIRKDSGADELEYPDDYGLDMQIVEQKYMEGFPADEFTQPNSDLFADPAIRFDGQQKTDDDKEAEVIQDWSKELEQTTQDLCNVHINTEQDADTICPDIWRAATVWSKFIIDMDSIVCDTYTDYTIFVDGNLTNSETKFSCKIRLIHSDWKKSICEICNPDVEPMAVCEHILALVINLELATAPERSAVPSGWN